MEQQRVMGSGLFMVAAVFAVITALLLVVVLRTTSAVAGASDGVIVKKAFTPAGRYTQFPVGADRGMRIPTDIPIAESYVFEIRVEGLDQNLFFALNTVASRSFEVGHRVRVVYRKRGVPFAAKKYLVVDMQPVTTFPTTAPGR